MTIATNTEERLLCLTSHYYDCLARGLSPEECESKVQEAEQSQLDIQLQAEGFRRQAQILAAKHAEKHPIKEVLIALGYAPDALPATCQQNAGSSGDSSTCTDDE